MSGAWVHDLGVLQVLQGGMRVTCSPACRYSPWGSFCPGTAEQVQPHVPRIPPLPRWPPPPTIHACGAPATNPHAVPLAPTLPPCSRLAGAVQRPLECGPRSPCLGPPFAAPPSCPNHPLPAPTSVTFPLPASPHHPLLPPALLAPPLLPPLLAPTTAAPPPLLPPRCRLTRILKAYSKSLEAELANGGKFLRRSLSIVVRSYRERGTEGADAEAVSCCAVCSQHDRCTKPRRRGHNCRPHMMRAATSQTPTRAPQPPPRLH